MPIRTFLASLFAVLPLAAVAHSQDFDRTLTVAGQSDLYVSEGSGTIRVFPGSDNSIHVKAHVHANQHAGDDSAERIQKILRNPPIQQSGNVIHIGNSEEDRQLYNNISIDYEIAAPKSVALNLHTGSGDLEVNNLGRSLKAQTGSGSVRAHGIAGSADLHTGSGDIELQQASAGEVHAQTGSGSIRIHGLFGALTAHTGSGDIEANGQITGASRLESGSGSIRAHLGHDTHLNVDASTGSGTIRVASLSTSDRHHLSTPLNGGGPALEARTGSGDIEIE